MEEIKESADKLLCWMETFGFNVLLNDDIIVQIEGPDGKKQTISKEKLYFINGYLFGTLIKGLNGQF